VSRVQFGRSPFTSQPKTMDADEATSHVAAGGAEREYVPVDGSWVAELEEAKQKLDELLQSSSGRGSKSGGSGGGALLLKAYLRLCRAYATLRQWNKLDGAAQKALRH
jgi:hypothetical protein